MRRTSPAARISSISTCPSGSWSPMGLPFAAAASTAWAAYARRASPARPAASAMTAYSSPVSVNSTRRVRGTGCRARRRPCPLLPAWLLPLMVPAILLMLPARRAQFLTAFVLPPADFPGGRLYRWPCPGASVRLDRARSRRKGGLSHILLRGPDGHLHLMQKALANGRAFLLLAADPTVTQTRRKRNWSTCSRKSSPRCRVVGHAEPRAIQRPDLCPVRRAGHTGPGRQDQPGVTGLVLAGPSGDRPAGVWVNT